MEKNSPENDLELDDQKGSKRISYVSRGHKSMVDFVALIYNNLGHAEYHNNKAIATVHGLSHASIKQQLTSSQQYKLLELKFGVGYKPTDLFTRIFLPVNDAEKRSAVIESLKSPETYQELFKQYEFHVVPPVAGLKNYFVRNLQFRDDIAEKAAQIFIENLKDYDLLDARGVLTSGINYKPSSTNGSGSDKPATEKPAEEIKPPPPPPDKPAPKHDDLFELPIPLPNKRKAYLHYPIDNLTSKDIKVIHKAIDFIASSLEDYEAEPNAESKIEP